MGATPDYGRLRYACAARPVKEMVSRNDREEAATQRLSWAGAVPVVFPRTVNM